MNPVWYRLRQATLLLATLYSSLALMTRLALALLGLTLVAVSPASAITFTLDQTFDDPTITSSDIFGSSVAIDGNNVLIGAPRDETNGSHVGQATDAASSLRDTARSARRSDRDDHDPR